MQTVMHKPEYIVLYSSQILSNTKFSDHELRFAVPGKVTAGALPPRIESQHYPPIWTVLCTDLASDQILFAVKGKVSTGM